MNKVYTRINWENYPSEKTAVCEENLNKMDFALDEVDKRVVQHETVKADVALLNELINYWHIDETTGVITIHKVSGEQIIFDLNIEKVPVGFSMTDDGNLIMTTDDGTEFTANIGSMIPVLTFNDSEQIAVAVSGEGVNKTYTFTIKTGSITEDKLQPNFLADCRLYAGNAEESANKSEEYAKQAQELVDEAEASFTELSYADYKAGNYDATKTYAIPDYPYSDGIASRIKFDDTNAQLGADDVQGAIDAIQGNLSKIGISVTETKVTGEVPNATKTLVAKIENLEPGLYYFKAYTRWAAVSGDSEVRSIFVRNGANTEVPEYDLWNYINSAYHYGKTGHAFVQEIVVLFSVGETNNAVGLWAYQNSGADKTISMYGINAKKIG